MSGRGLYLLRHAESEANARRVRSGGDDDSPLTGFGRRQARALAQRLPSLANPPGVIVAAPLGRVMETARIVNEVLGVDLLEEPGLLERSLGEWNGRTYEETEAMFRERMDPPGGETGPEFRERVVSAFERFAPLCAKWPLVVTSKGVSRVVFERWEIAGDPLNTCELARVRMTEGDGADIASAERIVAS